MAPVEDPDLADIVIPLSASRVKLVPASGEEDARADYTIADVNEDTLRDWFVAHMPEAGWDRGEDRDGALLFEHRTETSPHPAEDGGTQPRTALVLFGVMEGTDFSIVAESAPAP
jgi:hypothetical protein